MTDHDYQTVIAREWMEKSEVALKTAEVLFREKLFVGCVNRLYYAAFYAVSAALAKQGKECGKHTAVRASLNRDFVKTGIVSDACSKTYNRLFDDRQEGDFSPRTSFKEEDIGRMLVETRALIDCFKALIG